MIITLIALTIASGLICYITATHRGLNKHQWCAKGLLFGPFAIPFVLLVNTESKKD